MDTRRVLDRCAHAGLLRPSSAVTTRIGSSSPGPSPLQLSFTKGASSTRSGSDGSDMGSVEEAPPEDDSPPLPLDASGGGGGGGLWSIFRLVIVMTATRVHTGKHSHSCYSTGCSGQALAQSGCAALELVVVNRPCKITWDVPQYTTVLNRDYSTPY